MKSVISAMCIAAQIIGNGILSVPNDNWSQVSGKDGPPVVIWTVSLHFHCRVTPKVGTRIQFSLPCNGKVPLLGFKNLQSSETVSAEAAKLLEVCLCDRRPLEGGWTRSTREPGIWADTVTFLSPKSGRCSEICGLNLGPRWVWRRCHVPPHLTRFPDQIKSALLWLTPSLVMTFTQPKHICGSNLDLEKIKAKNVLLKRMTWSDLMCRYWKLLSYFQRFSMHRLTRPIFCWWEYQIKSFFMAILGKNSNIAFQHIVIEVFWGETRRWPVTGLFNEIPVGW